MLDIAGVLMLVCSLIGSLKMRGLPIGIPQLIILANIVLIIIQTAYRRTKFTMVYTAAIWASLVWIAGISLESSWGKGVLISIAVWMLLIVTPIIIILHQRIYRRFNPAAGKKLELARTKTAPFLKRIFKRNKLTSTVEEEIKLIIFDLGEEVNFQNK